MQFIFQTKPTIDIKLYIAVQSILLIKAKYRYTLCIQNFVLIQNQPVVRKITKEVLD